MLFTYLYNSLFTCQNLNQIPTMYLIHWSYSIWMYSGSFNRAACSTMKDYEFMRLSSIVHTNKQLNLSVIIHDHAKKIQKLADCFLNFLGMQHQVHTYTIKYHYNKTAYLYHNINVDIRKNLTGENEIGNKYEPLIVSGMFSEITLI